MSQKRRVAVIGCGISAAAFYHFLDKDKFDVSFFEKSRGVGGRMPSKRLENIYFDHGATCFGAIRSQPFKKFIEPYVKKGIISEWQGEFKYLDLKSYDFYEMEKKRRLVCHEYGNSLVKEMLKEPLKNGKIFFNTRIIEVKCGKNKNSILSDKGEIFDDFDFVISSTPAPQTLELFPKNFCFRKLLEIVEYDSTFAMMMSFEKDVTIDFSHLAVKNSIISRISYENSKGGNRNFDLDCFVINASNEFSNTKLDLDINPIQRDMVAEFFKILPQLKKENLRDVIMHRWLYANAKTSYDFSPLFDGDMNIGAIGDYVKEPRYEFAFESGYEMAELVNFLNADISTVDRISIS